MKDDMEVGATSIDFSKLLALLWNKNLNVEYKCSKCYLKDGEVII